MKHACLVPETHSADLTGAMATLLRTEMTSFDGCIDDVERRAFDILWSPAKRFTYAEIRPRLTAAIAAARAMGLINLHKEPEFA